MSDRNDENHDDNDIEDDDDDLSISVKYLPQEVPYALDGTNPNLKDYKYCRECSTKDDNVPLFRCTRCKLVYYCSKKCQKDNFRQHKTCCKAIEDLTKGVAEEYETLHTCLKAHWPEDEPIDYFERVPELYWSIPEAPRYIFTKINLALEIKKGIVDDHESKEAWDVVVHHFQEALRMSGRDHFNIRELMPVNLLHLNRDDDCFVFCRHWCRDDWPVRELLHRNSKEGDWIYGHEKDCRFLDFFAECAPADPKKMPLIMLAAIALIKIRLCIANEFRRDAVETFRETSAGAILEPVMPAIGDMCVGDDSVCSRMQGQKTQLNRLLNQIDKNNPWLLPSLLNPDFYCNVAASDVTWEGHPSEARSVQRKFFHLWYHTPGAQDWLKPRYDPDPTFESVTESYLRRVHGLPNDV